VDSVRARVFSKCAKGIMSAVKQGGTDPDQNLKLRYAIEKARISNMPKDNIERAIKRASGEGMGDIEELIYEGYAPGGVAMMVTTLTDNRNRTAADIKYIFEKRGGSLGAQGSVGFLFDFRSIFVVESGDRDEDALMELALECGCDDVLVEDDVATFFAAATEFLSTKEALETAGLTFLSAELGYVPQTSVGVESKEDAIKLFKLLAALDENEDVQNVYANYDMPGEWVEELGA
jgi:YebC/PmpR family DNA-binding regulatory protein